MQPAARSAARHAEGSHRARGRPCTALLTRQSSRLTSVMCAMAVPCLARISLYPDLLPSRMPVVVYTQRHRLRHAVVAICAATTLATHGTGPTGPPHAPRRSLYTRAHFTRWLYLCALDLLSCFGVDCRAGPYSMYPSPLTGTRSNTIYWTLECFGDYRTSVTSLVIRPRTPGVRANRDRIR